MGAASRPDVRLSVVIAAWNGKDAIERCLRSLEGDAEAVDTEVIVASNFDGEAAEMIRTQIPSVRHVCMPCGTPVPKLRAAGIRHARGEVVALAEDHCTFQKNW